MMWRVIKANDFFFNCLNVDQDIGLLSNFIFFFNDYFVNIILYYLIVWFIGASKWHAWKIDGLIDTHVICFI